MAGRAQSQITEIHFKLLQEYGRNPLRKRLSEGEQRAMWAMLCNGASVAPVPHDQVVAAWKTFVGGESSDSGLALNGDIDPNFVTIGITYRGRLAASHTTRTVAILRKLLAIFSKLFSTEDEFMAQVQRLAVESLRPPPKKTSANP